jgi:hypothetical protein
VNVAVLLYVKLPFGPQLTPAELLSGVGLVTCSVMLAPALRVNVPLVLGEAPQLSV